MCLVYRARFRGSSECLRCGADLTMVMTLVASAWRMRQTARRALAAGESARTHELASQAQRICYTPAGKMPEELIRRPNGIKGVSGPNVHLAFGNCRSCVDVRVEFIDRQNFPIASSPQHDDFAMLAGDVDLAVHANR